MASIATDATQKNASCHCHCTSLALTQRAVHMGQHASGEQLGTSPSRQLGLKQRTASGPGPLQVDGALSHCSTAKPVALNSTTTWRSTLTSWSGAQQYPQHVLSTFSGALSH